MSSPTTKIAAIGAGSFVFTQRLLHDVICRHRMAGCELVLMDLDAELAETMAAIARRMAADTDVTLTISSTGDRAVALRGADFVTASVAAQLLRRYEMDREVLRRHGIREPNAECGGLGGLSYTLRQVPLLLAIARDMERLCPSAWLLNVSNPLPRLVTAVARHTAIKVAGFCNVAWGSDDGYGNVGRLLGRPAAELDVVSAGLNHFAWLLSVRDRRTGEDLLPAVGAALERGGTVDGALTRLWWRRFGWLPLAGDSHTGEFLPFEPELGREHIAHHGDAAERAARRRQLEDCAAGKAPWQPLLAGGAWERPANVIQALRTDAALHLDMINIPNHGAIAGLPDDAVVEVPAEVRAGGICGVRIGPLPEGIAEICRQVSQVHGLVAEAAATGDRAVLAEAIRLDPAITEKAAAARAMQELLEIHADLLPQFR